MKDRKRKNKWESAAMVRILRCIAKLVGRPLSTKKSYLVNALFNVEYLKHCYAEIDVYDSPFYFDMLRLSYHHVMSLIERTHVHDCYRFKEVVVEDPVVLDVGAHIGVFSRYVLAEKPKSTLYALEPDRDNFKLLTMNLKSFDQAFCFKKGVFNRKDSLEFYTSKKLDWRSSLMVKKDFKNRPGFEPGEYTTTYTVEVTDIDSFVTEAGVRKLDLLKITVPGEIEHLALSGAIQIISKSRPQISIYVYPENMPKVELFFKKIGGYCEVPCPYTPSRNIKIFQSS